MMRMTNKFIMKRIRKFKQLFPVICCMLLASCSLVDFSEDCTYYGNVEMKPDWSKLEKEEIKPGLTDIHLLSPQNNYSYRITADTLVKDVQAVSYTVLACNAYRSADIGLSGMNNPQTAEAELRTYQKEGKTYTVQAPDFYAANTGLQVIPFETVVCKPELKAAVRRINIDFMVVDNTNTGVSSISGELSGIAYRYGFKVMDELESEAWLEFDTKADSSKTNLFSSHLKVFGVNPDKQASEKRDNVLDILLTTTAGETYRESIDLTEVFSGFTSRIMNISLEIRLGLMGMDVVITGWDVSDGGIIEL